jgi:hypothetical protein
MLPARLSPNAKSFDDAKHVLSPKEESSSDAKSGLKELANYAPIVRYVALPMIALSGLLRRLVKIAQSHRQQTYDYLNSYIDLLR